MYKKYIWLIILVLFGCKNNKKVASTNLEDSLNSPYKIAYAKGFTVAYFKGYKLVTIPQAWQGSKEKFTYALVEKGAKTPVLDDAVQIIRVPIKSIVCMSTSHLPLLEYLGELDKLVGFPHTKYISSPAVSTRLAKGKIKELGTESGLNIEMLMALSPEVVMDFGYGNEYDNYKSIQKVGIPVIMNADYMEETPLGRAEWIKFAGLFFGKEKEADSIFNMIKNKYNSLKKIAANSGTKPTVYSGTMYGDVWYMPGGKNSGAIFVNDAGGDYLWKEDSVNGSLQLGFESVYDHAQQADFWIGMGSFNSLEEIENTDERYTSFEAFKNGNVYNYNAVMGENGGNAFLELGYLRPDIILADMIKILHPALLPEHKLYFYKKLN